MFYYYYDWTYLLVLIGVVICMAASSRVRSVFSRYSRVRSHSGMTGKEAAEQILRRNGIYDVQVIHIPGNLTDHYNPGKKTLGLSDSVYNSSSVAAIGVAAHECGHAVQHAVGYAPLSIRGALVPVANFGSALSWPLIHDAILSQIRRNLLAPVFPSRLQISAVKNIDIFLQSVCIYDARTDMQSPCNPGYPFPIR